MDWDELVVTFLDRFFPFKLREPKVHEFINLMQHYMSVKKYILMFSKVSKYAR